MHAGQERSVWGARILSMLRDCSPVSRYLYIDLWYNLSRCLSELRSARNSCGPTLWLCGWEAAHLPSPNLITIKDKLLSHSTGCYCMYDIGCRCASVAGRRPQAKDHCEGSRATDQVLGGPPGSVRGCRSLHWWSNRWTDGINVLLLLSAWLLLSFSCQFLCFLTHFVLVIYTVIDSAVVLFPFHHETNKQTIEYLP